MQTTRLNQDLMQRENRDRIGYDVINSLKNGDHMSYNRVYVKYYDAIYRFILALVKSSDAANDISQDVFIKIWEKREKLDPTRNFNGLIYRMARNAAIDYMKIESRLDDAQDVNEVDVSEFVSSDDPIICKEIQLLILLAIKQMPAQRRRIFEMAYNDGLSPDEIADRLCLKKHNVQKQISMGRAELRHLFALMVIILTARASF